MLDVMACHIHKTLGKAPFSPWVRTDTMPFIQAEVGRGWRDVFALDGAVFGGGGYFTGKYRRSLHYSLPARVWQKKGIPYVVAGVGVGPFITPAAAKEFKVVCNGAKAICVRDEESKEILSGCGVEPERIEVTADAVLSLTPEMIPAHAMEEARSLLEKAQGYQRLFGIQWGSAGPRRYTWSPPFLTRDPHPAMNKLTSALMPSYRGHEEEVGLVWLLNFYNRSTAKSIQEAVLEVFPRSIFLQVQDHWVMTALLALLDGVFTTMLHYGITAWILGTPPCAWAAHGKTERFYRQIGRENFVSNLGEAEQRLTDWFRSFMETPQEFAVEASDARERLRNLAHRNYEVIAEHIP